MNRIYIIAFCFLFISMQSFAQEVLLFANVPAEPELFGPGIISDEYGNRDMALSPGGDELFYTLQYRGGFVFSTIMHCRKINGTWAKPEVASFCGQYNDLEPAFSADGNTLYFSSSRPISGDRPKDFDIWFVKKVNGEWGTPQNAGVPMNTGEDEFYASVARNGNIYFTRAVKGREEDIMMCAFANDHYAAAVALSDSVNSDGDEFNAFVDPDERYIIFTGYKRDGNLGSGDLLISFMQKNGEWGKAQNMGDKINGPGLTYCPYVSPDGKYFFFTSSRGIFKTPFEKRKNFSELKSYMQSPHNGWDNIYWMDAAIILNRK